MPGNSSLLALTTSDLIRYKTSRRLSFSPMAGLSLSA